MSKKSRSRTAEKRDPKTVAFWSFMAVALVVIVAGYFIASNRDTDSDYVSTYVPVTAGAPPAARQFPPVEASNGRPKPVVALFGDSYSEGAGAADPESEGYAALLANGTGWDLRVTSLSGGGYRNPGVDGSGPFTRKIDAADLPGIKPDLIIIQGGLNDAGFGEETLAGSKAAIAAARAAAPGTPIAVVGLLWGQGAMSDVAQRPYDAIKASAEAAPNVLFIPTKDLRFPLGQDGVHPTSQGHAEIYNAIRGALRQAHLEG